MPVRWAVASGNWSDVNTWNSGSVLGIPTGSDEVWTNSYSVNIDQSFEVVGLRNTSRSNIATPQMTSNTTPTPYVIAASSTDGVNPAWAAFDRNNATGNGWVSANTSGGSGSLSVDFGAGNSIAIEGYTMYAAGTSTPSRWTFEASNNAVSWTILQTVTSSIGANGSYSAAGLNTTSYRYYRVNIGGSTGTTQVVVRELELYQPGTAALAAGGSFIFNSGSISGSATSTTAALTAGATNLIQVTATTGSVTLNLGSAVTPPALSSANLINHSGNCNFNLIGQNFNGRLTGTVSGISCIYKSSAGLITIVGNLNGGTTQTGTIGNNIALNSIAGNSIIVGNVTGGSITSAGGNMGIFQSAGNLTITGTITGGQSTSTHHGIRFSGTSLTVNGTIIGGTAASAIDSSAPVFINGDVSGSGAASISSTSAIPITVSGSVIASATANGISSTNASAVVNLTGNLVNVNGKQAIYCQNLFLDNTATTQARFFTFGGQDRTLYSVDTFPNLPSSSNVRFGTSYGPGSGNTGTLRMASPQDVRSGVLTDNTTGSAILSMESLSNEIQTSTDPFAQRLRNISTVDTVGYLLTAFKK
jgi:hypothetical protein